MKKLLGKSTLNRRREFVNCTRPRRLDRSKAEWPTNDKSQRNGNKKRKWGLRRLYTPRWLHCSDRWWSLETLLNRPFSVKCVGFLISNRLYATLAESHEKRYGSPKNRSLPNFVNLTRNTLSNENCFCC